MSSRPRGAQPDAGRSATRAGHVWARYEAAARTLQAANAADNSQRIGDLVLLTGGCHLGRRDVLHDGLTGPGGALIFLRGAGPDAALAIQVRSTLGEAPA